MSGSVYDAEFWGLDVPGLEEPVAPREEAWTRLLSAAAELLEERNKRLHTRLPARGGGSQQRPAAGYACSAAAEVAEHTHAEDNADAQARVVALETERDKAIARAEAAEYLRDVLAQRCLQLEAALRSRGVPTAR